MNLIQEQVREFMEMVGQDRPSFPMHGDATLREFRSSLIREELKEYDDAETMEDIADAIGDMLYVVFGAAVAHGLDAGRIVSEIHRSNMTKKWTFDEIRTELHPSPEPQIFETISKSCEIIKVKVVCVNPDLSEPSARNYIVKNLAGKAIKSPSYSPANLKIALVEPGVFRQPVELPIDYCRLVESMAGDSVIKNLREQGIDVDAFLGKINSIIKGGAK